MTLTAQLCVFSHRFVDYYTRKMSSQTINYQGTQHTERAFTQHPSVTNHRHEKVALGSVLVLNNIVSLPRTGEYIHHSDNNRRRATNPTTITITAGQGYTRMLHSGLRVENGSLCTERRVVGALCRRLFQETQGKYGGKKNAEKFRN